MRREVEARAGDAGVDAEEEEVEAEREGEAERFHQRIGIRYVRLWGEARNPSDHEVTEMASRGEGIAGRGGRRRPPRAIWAFLAAMKRKIEHIPNMTVIGNAFTL